MECIIDIDTCVSCLFKFIQFDEFNCSISATKIANKFIKPNFFTVISSKNKICLVEIPCCMVKKYSIGTNYIVIVNNKNKIISVNRFNCEITFKNQKHEIRINSILHVRSKYLIYSSENEFKSNFHMIDLSNMVEHKFMSDIPFLIDVLVEKNIVCVVTPIFLHVFLKQKLIGSYKFTQTKFETKEKFSVVKCDRDLITNKLIHPVESNEKGGIVRCEIDKNSKITVSHKNVLGSSVKTISVLDPYRSRVNFLSMLFYGK